MPTPKRSISSRVAKQNPRPRKYASAAEKQAAFRARFPTICVRVEPKTADTIQKIGDASGRTQQETMLSLVKFALTNRDFVNLGLTEHKQLPRMEETRKANPMKRKPTPAQIAARERFAEMARSGAFKKKAIKKNPRASNPIKKFIVYTETKPGNWKQVRVTENLDIAKDLAKSNAESGYPSIVEDATGAIVYTPKVASNPIILVSDKPIASKRKANPVKRKVMKEKRPFYYVVKVGQSYDGQFLSTHYSLEDVKKIAQQKADKYGAQARITEFHS